MRVPQVHAVVCFQRQPPQIGDTLDGETLDEHAALLAQLVRTRASTVEGVLAKARASRYLFHPTETVAEKIREGVREFGVDCDVLILSMARDLIELAAVAW